MFTWYRDAIVCYAYLADVKTIDQIRSSKWFSRGWTLRELLAPKSVVFFSAEWNNIGNKMAPHLCDTIAAASGIEKKYLENNEPLWRTTVAKRMSWASKRVTTRVEDMAYCLLGIFEIHMPLLYGEGSHSFIRLQEELIKQSNDETIFCWSWKPDLVPKGWSSVLAPCAAVFENSGHFHSYASDPYSITNAGLSIRVELRQTESAHIVLALLHVSRFRADEFEYNSHLQWSQFCIVLQADSHDKRRYIRLPYPEAPFEVLGLARPGDRNLFMECRKHATGGYADLVWPTKTTQASRFQAENFGILLISEGYQGAGIDSSLVLRFHSDGVTYHKFESLLTFSFPDPDEKEGVRIVLFDSKLLNEDGLALYFAVRESTSENGDIEHHSSCNFIPMVESNLKAALEQLGNEFSAKRFGTHFAEHSHNTVLLGYERMVYSSANGPSKNLQLAYLAYKNKEFSATLREVAFPPWFRDSDDLEDFEE